MCASQSQQDEGASDGTSVTCSSSPSESTSSGAGGQVSGAALSGIKGQLSAPAGAHEAEP